MKLRLASILAIVIVSLWLPAQALAAAPEPPVREVAITAPAGSIGARVSPIPVLVTGGHERTGHIRVDNVSGLIEDVTIRVADYSIDAAGTPVLAPAGFAFGSAGWYRFETPDFSLAPGTSRDVAFSLVVPAGAGAGDHFAALNVTVQAQPGQVAPSGGASARSVLLFRSRLQHRIEGALPQTPTVALTSSSTADGVRFTAHVGNAGNTVVGHQADPVPTLALYNVSPWGDPNRPERVLPIAGFYVAPRAVRDVSVDWTDVPLLGQYRAVFTLPAADGQPAVTAETMVTLVNVPVLVGLVAGVLLAALILVALVSLRTRRARRIRRAPSADLVRLQLP